MTITYIVGNGIYVNLTNRCTNRCSFCIRNNGDGAYGSDSLWLEREPTVEEVLADFEKYDMIKYDEIVYCGYGEPTIRIDTLLETAKVLKEKYKKPIRINTNGQGSLINKRNIAPLFKHIIDTVSISLNAADAESYEKMCLPVYGKKAYEALIEFGRECVPYVKNVLFSVVRQTLSEDEISACEQIAKKAGVKLRIRELV
ncbi:MAG TPA: TIGR04100 family radical SAM protein [Clostridiales bacterium]|nr:TIGR04100 family radical SAM protein [Clostridiales bacterium]